MTIKDLARETGYSVGTVSRVLNGKDTVSPGTRQRVLQAARDLAYDPSAAMPISPSRKLLALLPGFENPFYAPIIQGIQHTAHTAGFELLLMPIGDNGASASSLASMIRNEDYKGIIWLCAAPGPDVLSEVDALCPSVMIGEYPEGYTGSYVSIDDRTAGYRADQYRLPADWYAELRLPIQIRPASERRLSTGADRSGTPCRAKPLRIYSGH